MSHQHERPLARLRRLHPAHLPLVLRGKLQVAREADEITRSEARRGTELLYGGGAIVLYGGCHCAGSSWVVNGT